MIYQFITENRTKSLFLKKVCPVFSVSPSGYFKSVKSKAQDKSNKKEEEIGKAFELYKGRYGYRKFSHYLNRSGGVFYSPAQVRHALKERGLKARKARPTSKHTIRTKQS